MIEPRIALAVHRIALAAVALLVPRTAGRLYGLDFETHTAGAELTRLMASRNLLLGIGLLLADAPARPLLTRLNLAVDAIDIATVSDETRRGALPRTATVVGMITAGAATGLGVAAIRAEK
jgi:hypothetical protein